MTKTESKIRELVPILQELSTGCKYRYRCTGEVEYWYGRRHRLNSNPRKKASNATAVKRVRVTDRDKEWREYTVGETGKFYHPINEWFGRLACVRKYGDGKDEIQYVEMEIIGHPIQLHHVLQAISGDGKLADDGVVINAGGDMVVLKNENGDVTTTSEIVTWDLTKNFHDQTAEVQMFISYLLE